MNITAGGPLESESGEALAVPVFEDRTWGPGADWAAEQLGDWLDEYLDEQDFSGKAGEILAVPTGGRLGFRTLFLVGLGSDVDLEALRKAAGWLGRKAAKTVDVATTLHQVDLDGTAGAVVEGFLLGQYRFDTYKSEPKPAKTESLRFVGEGAEDAAGRAGDAAVIVDAVVLARDLINEPALAKAPAVLADKAREIGRSVGVTVKVLEPDEIEAERLGGLMGVSMGAHNPARLVEFAYEPADPKAFLALVGKGIVFDSGGLSLKTGTGMETMKTDMSGAAAVFGAVQAIASLGIAVKVIGIAPLTENMPGGGAMRPGDVIRPRNGKTVEVLNTDAEGRLVLADGLSLASEAEPDLIVDVATLTGACKVALGEKIGGLWANDDDAAEQVLAAAARAGERFWHMPLPDDYRKNIDSDIADMKNTGIRWGGAINAALFLSEFVAEGVPWVHLDIAGPGRWPEDEHYQFKGGSGFGVRTLIALAEDLAS
ncbi:MAG: leucyl aminopeptidase [Gammaproteobacteria bacterium]|nr:leucyl aminopeptidase [Gammaproteobacteria bacterium]